MQNVVHVYKKLAKVNNDTESSTPFGFRNGIIWTPDQITKNFYV